MLRDVLEAAFCIGGSLCHQLSYRSFIYNDYQFFLCARCSGIYVLIFSALVLCPKQILLSYKVLFLLLLCSLAINFILKGPGFFDTNSARFILGSLIGLSCGLIIKKSIGGMVVQYP